MLMHPGAAALKSPSCMSVAGLDIYSIHYHASDLQSRLLGRPLECVIVCESHTEPDTVPLGPF